MTQNVQWVAFRTIVTKELVRIFRIWKQTLLPPVITQTLYFLVFGTFIGARISEIDGQSYAEFIVPGLVMMVVIQSAFGNTVGSLFGAKFGRQIEEVIVSLTKYRTLLAGFVTGGIVRGLLTGVLVFIVSMFFAQPTVAHWWAIAVFVLLTAIVFSLAGFLNGLFAKTFDDTGIFTTFLITPLTYLGGVFYTIDHLAEPWRTLSLFNPIVYMVDGLRYGFSGHATTNPAVSALVLVLLATALWCANMHLLKKGTGLRA